MSQPFRNYLHGRGITDAVIDRYGISGDDTKISIPIKGFNKYRTYPEKRYFYDKGFSAALFGVSQLTQKWCVLTEGELDALRLASEDIPAVSGSGGAGTFKDEWISELPPLVFICYDTDQAGQDNALKVHWKISNSRIIQLPEGKDVTEYLAKHTKQEFEQLIIDSVVILKPIEPIKFRLQKCQKPKGKETPISLFIQFNQNKAKCIWHKEGTPSLHYYEKQNRVYCFGCQKWGDVLDVVQQLRGVSLQEAINILAV